MKMHPSSLEDLKRRSRAPAPEFLLTVQAWGLEPGAWGLRVGKFNQHPSDARSAGLVDADWRTTGRQLLCRTVALM